MSVASYFGSGRPRLFMRKKEADELGVRFEGTVAAGGRTVEEQLKWDAARRAARAEDTYEGVEDYDAVLRAHCRV